MATQSPSRSSRLCVGYVAGSHGVQGTVRVHLFDADSRGLEPGLELVLVRRDDGTEVTRKVVAHVAPIPGKTARARVELDGVRGREAADALKGLSIEVERDALGPLDEDEFYLADAIGLRVERAQQDGSLQKLGKVVAVTTNGAQDLFEVEYRSAKGRTKRWLIPVLPGFVRDVDETRVLVDPPLGLLPDELEQP